MIGRAIIGFFRFYLEGGIRFLVFFLTPFALWVFYDEFRVMFDFLVNPARNLFRSIEFLDGYYELNFWLSCIVTWFALAAIIITFGNIFFRKRG